MLKKYARFVAWMITAVLFLALLTTSATALTSKEKDELYNGAIVELESYLEAQEEDPAVLEDIYEQFKSLKGYEKSTGFAGYVNLLILVSGDEIDEYELDFQLSKLLKNTVFTEYLENELKDSPIHTVKDLENYINGRKAQAEGDDAAGDYYEACLFYFDSEIRFDSLHDTAAQEHYEKAMELFKEHEFEEAYREFELANGYEDSAERMEYLEEKYGFTRSHEHEWIEATCTEPRICAICQTTDGEPLGHNFGDARVTKAATCNENGVKTVTCGICGATEETVIPATGNHQWDGGTVIAVQTCTADGKTVYTCQLCGEQKTEENTKTGEHQWDKGKVTKKATCLKDGEKTYTCTRCGETKKEKVKAYGSHNWDEGKVTKKADCTHEGETTFTCTRCGETKKEKIKPNGSHKWDKGTVTKEATCVEDGTRTFKCAVCGQTKKEAIKATGKHSWTPATVSAPKTCTVCGLTEGSKLTTYYRYRDTTTAYTEWSWGDWSTSKQGISDSNLMKEETREKTKYEWWAAKCNKCGTHNPYHGSESKCHSCGAVLKKGAWTSVTYFTDSKDYSQSSHYGRGGAHNFGNWYWITSTTKKQTEYRYATRTSYQETGAWSSWSTQKPESKPGREIDTKTE